MSRINLENPRITDPDIYGQMKVHTQPATVVNTAGNVTYTAAQILSGRILRDPNGAARTDTFPTAVLLAAALRERGAVYVGLEVSCIILNTADAAESITMAVGAGGTVGNGAVTVPIAQNGSQRFSFRITGAAVGAETYTVYSA